MNGIQYLTLTAITILILGINLPVCDKLDMEKYQCQYNLNKNEIKEHRHETMFCYNSWYCYYDTIF